MRRTLMSITALLFGTALLVGLKYQGVAGVGLVAGAPQDPAGSDDPGGAGPGGPGAPGGPAPSGPGATRGATPGLTPPPGTTPRPGQTTPAPGPTTPSGGGTTTAPSGGGTTTPSSVTVTGAAIAVRTAESPTTKSSSCGECANYTISVTLTVSGGRITRTSVAYNPSPGGSQSYASRANNQLSQSILTAQTWNLGRVSGATYAGNAWELSAKDAMSRAGLSV
jgi:uncharacterized protein with FMN-binding domain